MYEQILELWRYNISAGKKYGEMKFAECLLYSYDVCLLFFSPLQDNKDLYAEEAAAQRERERQHMLSIPGLIAPNEIQDEMVDS